MNAKELRVGNLLFVNNKIKEIYNLYSNGWDFLQDEIECRFVEYENTNPIPLTEEWLLKLGFNTEYKKGYIGIDHKAGGMITDFALTYPKVLGVFQEYFIWEHSKYKYTELKYVHELQNLFFCLTGAELTVA